MPTFHQSGAPDSRSSSATARRPAARACSQSCRNLCSRARLNQDSESQGSRSAARVSSAPASSYRPSPISVNARSVACRHEAEGRCRTLPKILTIPACQFLAFPACRSFEGSLKQRSPGWPVPPDTLFFASNHAQLGRPLITHGLPSLGQGQTAPRPGPWPATPRPRAGSRGRWPAAAAPGRERPARARAPRDRSSYALTARTIRAVSGCSRYGSACRSTTTATSASTPVCRTTAPPSSAIRRCSAAGSAAVAPSGTGSTRRELADVVHQGRVLQHGQIGLGQPQLAADGAAERGHPAGVPVRGVAGDLGGPGERGDGLPVGGAHGGEPAEGRTGSAAAAAQNTGSAHSPATATASAITAPVAQTAEPMPSRARSSSRSSGPYGQPVRARGQRGARARRRTAR